MTPRFTYVTDGNNRHGVHDAGTGLTAWWTYSEGMAHEWVDRLNNDWTGYPELTWTDPDADDTLYSDEAAARFDAMGDWQPDEASVTHGSTPVPFDYAAILNRAHIRSTENNILAAEILPLHEAYIAFRVDADGSSVEGAERDWPYVRGEMRNHQYHLNAFHEWLDGHPDEVPVIGGTPGAAKPEPWEEHFPSREAYEAWYRAVGHRGNASEQCPTLDKLTRSMHGITRQQLGPIRRRVALPAIELQVESAFTDGNSHFGGQSLEDRIAEEVRRQVARLAREAVVEETNADPLPVNPIFAKEYARRSLTQDEVEPYRAQFTEFAALGSQITKGFRAAYIERAIQNPTEYYTTWAIFGYWLQAKESTHPCGPLGHLFKSREAFVAYWKKACKLAERAGQQAEYAQMAAMLGAPQAKEFEARHKVQLPEDFFIEIPGDTRPNVNAIADRIYQALTEMANTDTFRIERIEASL